MTTFITYHGTRPSNPQLGDVYMDSTTYQGWMWTGNEWTPFSGESSSEPVFTPPTEEQLAKHPALKEAWDEFMVLKKLIGV